MGHLVSKIYSLYLLIYSLETIQKSYINYNIYREKSFSSNNIFIGVVHTAMISVDEL